MKYPLYLVFLIVLLSACGNKQRTENETVQEDTVIKTKAGMLLAADSVRIVEDQLNESYFKVALLTTDYSHKGTYAIDANWGYNMATAEFTMPRGGEDLKPVLKKMQEPYTYIIGFEYEDDTTFYDYYIVHGQKGQIEMKYLKGYTFQ